MVLYLSNTCNLQCKYCFVQKENLVLSLENYIKVIEGYKNDISNITFFGGEPLLNRKLIKEIVNYNLDNHLEYKYVINTNALLLNEGDIKFCLENDITLNISLDGNKNSNLINRCTEENFDIIVKNIELAIHNGIIVFVNYVITPNNVSLFYESLVYLKNKKINKVCLLINYDAIWSNDDIDKFKSELYKSFELIYDGINKRDFIIYPIFNKINSILENKEVKKCNFGQETIAVSSTGKIYPCVSFVSNEKYEIKSLKDTFENLVNIDKCSDCKYNKYCVNNCMCRYFYKNYENTIDVNCEFEKVFIEFAYFIIKTMVEFR